MRQIKQFATFLTCAVLAACGGGGGVVEIDAAPEVSLTTNSKDVSGTFEVSASFSEAVEGFEIGDISVTNGELSNFVATNAGLAYTFDVTPQASGDVTLKVQAGVARDGAGNPNEASNTLTVTANLTGPSVTLRTTASDPVSGPFSVTATFSEAVEGFVVDDLVVTNADVDGFAGSGADYSFNVTPKVDGTVTIDVPAGVADATGGSSSSGGNTAAEQLSITADLTAPTILSLTTEASEPVSGVFSVKVVFSEPVEGFTASDINVVGGQVGAFSADSAGAEYDFDVTPLTTGTLTVNVAAGVAQDPAGNANTAATLLSVEASLTAPTLSLTTPAEHVSGNFLVTATFSEDVTGFEKGDISVGNGQVSGDLAGSGAVYTFTVAPTNDGPVTIDVAADAAVNGENTGNLQASTLTVTADFTAPTVALSTTATDPVGGTFSVTATFSEAVTGFDLSDVTLGNATADYFVTTSSSVYTFDVTPSSEGEVTIDVAASVGQDAAGNLNEAAATLSRSADLTAPSVQLSTEATDPVGGTFSVTATFSEAVSGFDLSDVTLGNATSSSFATTSSSVYTFDVTPSSEGEVTIDVAESVAQDVAGNLNEAAATLSLTADLTAPTVELSTTATDPVGGTFSVTATFSEAVSGFDLSDVTLGNATSSNFAATSSSVYTFDVTPSSEGEVTIDLAESVAQDAAGNLNEAALTLSLSADFTAPTVELSTTATDPVGGTFSVTATFSEAVSGFDLSDVTLGNATSSNFAATSSSVYTFDVTPSSEGEVTIDVAESVAQDAAGNLNEAALTLSLSADLTAPAVELSTEATDPVGGTFSVTATFSEAVSGFDLSDVTLGNATSSNFAATSSSVYTFDVTPSSEGEVTIDLAESVAQDAAGNLNEAALTLSLSADFTAPTVELSTTATDPVGGTFSVTATFSEAVSGFDLSDVTLGNATSSNFAATSSSVYTFDVTPSSEGEVTIDVAESVAQDAAGNLNEAALTLSLSADFTAPTVELSTTATDPVGGTFSVTATFSEAVSGFDLSDVTLGNATSSNFAATSSSVYTFDVTPSSEGEVTIDVAESVAQDAAGNLNEAALTLSLSADLTAPAVELSTEATDPVGGTFSVTATFSEAVLGFDLSDVTLGNATSDNFVATSSSVYTFDVTPSSEGEVTIDVAESVAQDVAGNLNEAALTLSLSADFTAPTVELSTTATDPVGGTFSVTATFSEAVSGFDLSDVTLGNATSDNFATTSSSVYTFDVTPSSEGEVTIDVAAGIAQDVAGNLNEAALTLSLSADFTAPAVELSTEATDPVGGTFSVTATFSEAVLGFDLSDVTLGNATSDNFVATSSSVYTFDVTPSSEGEVRIDVAESIAQDAAGNLNEAALTLSLTADFTAPTVELSTTATDPVGGTFSVTATFSEAVSGFDLSDVTLGNGTSGNFATTSSSVYTFDVTPNADGEVTVQVVEGAVADAAGNLNPASHIFSITADFPTPTVSLSTGAYSPVVDTFRVTATFSEDVTGFDSNDVTLGNGVLSNFSSSDEEPIYTFDVTPQATGDVTVDVAAGVAQSSSTGKSNATAVQLLRVADLSDGLVGIEQIYGGGTAVRDNWGSINDEVAGWDSNNVSCVSVVPTADTSSSVDCVDANYTDEWSWRGKSGDTNVGVDGPRGTGVHAWGTGGTVASFETSESLVMGFTDSIYPDNGFVDHDPIGAIGARQAYSLGITGAGVKVAVVDTGIDTDHVDLDGKITSQYDLCKDTAGVYNCDTVDTGTGDHGTHVAGIIAAKKDESGMHGVAYDAELVSIYFAENSELGLLSDEQDFADAIDGAVTNGVRIFNNSWGTVSEDNTNTFFDDQELVKNAVASAIAQGSVFVWAAGNSYSENTGLDAHNTSQNAKAALKYEEFMGGFVNVVNLVWDDSADEWVISNELSNSSNEANSQICGVTKDYCLGAPGSLIVSTVPDHGYLPNSGTSMAAPMVSGGLALLFQAFPYVETADILELLFVTADDLGAEGVDEIYGHGMMNLAAALEPSGSLTIATSSSTATNTGLSLTGASLSGDSAFVSAMSTAASDMVALDAFDRAYTVGATGMTTLGETETLSAAGLSDTLRADFEGLASFGSPITEAAALGNAVAAMDDQISLPDAALNYRAVSKETSTLAEVQYVALSSGDGWQVGQSIALTQEQGQLFGNVGTGAYALADAATTLTVGSNGTRQLGEDWTLFGGVGLSQTAVVPAAASVIAMSDQITSASAVMGLRRDQLGLDQTASFAVQVSQDRRVLNGSALTTIPVGRDDGGVIVLEETRLDEAALSIVPKVEMTYEEQINVNANITYSASSSELENVLAIDFERAF